MSLLDVSTQPAAIRTQGAYFYTGILLHCGIGSNLGTLAKQECVVVQEVRQQTAGMVTGKSAVRR